MSKMPLTPRSRRYPYLRDEDRTIEARLQLHASAVRPPKPGTFGEVGQEMSESSDGLGALAHGNPQEILLADGPVESLLQLQAPAVRPLKTSKSSSLVILSTWT